MNILTKACIVALFVLSAAGNSYGKVSLNSSSAVEIAEETGIPVEQAALIVRYRARIGAFIDIDQMYDIVGLDPSVIEQLRADAGVDL